MLQLARYPFNVFGANGLVARRSNSATTHYQFDNLGGTAHRLDGSGNVITNHMQDAFGQPTSSGVEENGKEFTILADLGSDCLMSDGGSYFWYAIEDEKLGPACTLEAALHSVPTGD
ncbi:MAG: hypothetical protein ABL949_14090 [Fimbriimonadaceae bacterium]